LENVFGHHLYGKAPLTRPVGLCGAVNKKQGAFMPAPQSLGMILHNLEVKLFHNYFPNIEGKYVARIKTNRTVNVKDICQIMVTRAGFDGSMDTLNDYVNQFLDEVAYQICDGFTANLGYFSLKPRIGGTFNSVNEAHDHKKHPISFTFTILSKLRSLISSINVYVDGLADVGGYIDEFEDMEEHSVSTYFVPGNVCAVHGSKIKVEGDNPDCGLYIIPLQPATVTGPAPAPVKVPRIIENHPSRITFVFPATGYMENKIRIITQYSGGKTPLANPRTIETDFTITEV
jgi:hypothetical protein